MCKGVTVEPADENCWEDDALLFAMSKLSLVEIAVVASMVDIFRL